MAEPPPLVCPACRTDLSHTSDGFRCASCGRDFPVVAGIPDLRLGGDRYLSLEEDRAKALELADVEGGFTDVVRAYWRMTPEVPTALAERYARAAFDGMRRGEDRLRALGAIEGCLIDVGCGTGGLVAAAARRGAAVVGVDLALRWLVIARRQLDDAGVDALLVAADGAQLPFRAGTFDHATSIEALEHTADQRGFLHSCLGAVRPGGTATIVTTNRFSLAPEPTVGLWGVGLLPRRFAAAYVRRRRHTRFQFVRPLSAWDLRAMIGPETPAVVTAAALPTVPRSASPARRFAQTGYERVRQLRSGDRLLTAVGPFLEVRSA